MNGIVVGLDDSIHSCAALCWAMHDGNPTEIGGNLPEVTVSVTKGNPAQELIKAACDADMLVVGSRGSGGFSKLLMGSVSSQVTHHAECPVVVIREPHPGL